MFRHTVFLKTFLPKANAKQMPTFSVIFKNIYRINVDKIDKASKQKKIFVKLSVFCIYVHIYNIILFIYLCFGNLTNLICNFLGFFYKRLVKQSLS